MSKFAKTIEKAREDKVEGPNFMKEMNLNAEFQNVKAAVNDLRLMYTDLDVCEAIRVIENALSVNNSSLSGLDRRLSEIVPEETAEEFQGETVEH